MPKAKPKHVAKNNGAKNPAGLQKNKHRSNKDVKRKIPFWPFGLALFSVLLFLDQYTKNAILKTMQLGASHKLFWVVSFTYVQNTGAIWGTAQNSNGLFVWISVIAFGLLIFFYDQFTTVFEKIAYVLLLVGLWGNMLDRVLHGFVVDFISVGWWPVFNIADSCITIGIAIYILEQLRIHNSKKTASKH